MSESDIKLQDKTTLIPARALAKMLSTSVRTVWRSRSVAGLDGDCPRYYAGLSGTVVHGRCL